MFHNTSVNDLTSLTSDFSRIFGGAGPGSAVHDPVQQVSP
jgi:hypothetical protein